MASAIHRRSAPACHCATSLDLCHELGISNFDGPQQFVRSTSQHRSHMRTSSQKGLLGPTCGEHGPRRNCQRDVPAHSLQVRRLLPLGLLRGPQCSVSGDPRESTDSCQRPAGQARGAHASAFASQRQPRGHPSSLSSFASRSVSDALILPFHSIPFHTFLSSAAPRRPSPTFHPGSSFQDSSSRSLQPQEKPNPPTRFGLPSPRPIKRGG